MGKFGKMLAEPAVETAVRIAVGDIDGLYAAHSKYFQTGRSTATPSQPTKFVRSEQSDICGLDATTTEPGNQHLPDSAFGQGAKVWSNPEFTERSSDLAQVAAVDPVPVLELDSAAPAAR